MANNRFAECVNRSGIPVFPALLFAGFALFFITVSCPKAKNRAEKRVNEACESIAEYIGDSRDDREAFVKERSRLNNELTEKLASLWVSIQDLEEDLIVSNNNAGKHKALAEKYASEDRDSLALSFIARWEDSEMYSSKLKSDITMLREKFEELQGRLNKSKEEVRQMIARSDLFEAQYTVIEIQKQIQEAENDFGSMINVESIIKHNDRLEEGRRVVNNNNPVSKTHLAKLKSLKESQKVAGK